MAWRQLASKKGKSVSIMTKISILGVTIGVAALVIVLSIMGGFERDLVAKMFRGLPHMEVFHTNPQIGISLRDRPIEHFVAEFPEATGIEPFTKSDVILKNGKHLSSTVLFGIDPKLGAALWGFFSGRFEGLVADLERRKFSDASDIDYLGGVILGEDLAIQLGVGVGEDVFIISPYASARVIASGGHISGQFRVVGIFQTDLPQFDSKYAVVSLAAGRRYLPDYDYTLDEDQFVSGIAVNFAEPEYVNRYRDNYYPDNYKVVTWKDTNHSLLVALQLEKFTMGSILLLVVLVAAFSISGTIMMTIFHRRSQIALMRALGMTGWEVGKLYLFVGLFIGSIGVLLGMSLGVLVCSIIHFSHIVHLPPGMYYHSRLPVKFLPLEYLVISLCAWLLSLVAVFYPSMIAAKQDPGDGLRCM